MYHEFIFQTIIEPTDVFQAVYISSGDRKMKKLLMDNRIAGISVTGSTDAGRHIARVAGERLLPSVMELGGSDPFIVLADAPLNKAVETAIRARLQNNGQSCIAAKRFLVQSVIGAKFIDMLIAGLESIKIGDPLDESTDVGPLARKDLVENLHRQVKESVNKGASIAWQSTGLPDKGFYSPVFVLRDVAEGMPAFNEETFGPLFAVTIVDSTDELIRLANSSCYGLGASVWTTNIQSAKRIIRQIESGMVFVNAMVRSDPRLPFGGIKDSGYGRELAREGLMSFVNIKTFWIES